VVAALVFLMLLIVGVILIIVICSWKGRHIAEKSMADDLELVDGKETLK